MIGTITASTFIAYLVANESHIPRAILIQLRRDARARLIERWQASRADSPLNFADLWERAESYVMPR